jgi:ferritin
MLKANVQEALNKQLNQEIESSYIYLSMAAWLEGKNFRGMARWMRVQAMEEWKHAMKFFDYVIERGGKVQLFDIAAPKSEWANVQDIFADSHKHEMKITGLIYGLAKLVDGEADYATQVFLQWFVTEQVEEEASVEQVVAKLKLVGDGHVGLLFMDAELGKRAG